MRLREKFNDDALRWAVVNIKSKELFKHGLGSCVKLAPPEWHALMRNGTTHEAIPANDFMKYSHARAIEVYGVRVERA